MATILIVEDEPAINDLILMNLQLVGYDCVQAYDGREAEKLLAARTFDLALLDIMLPEKDGFELLPLCQKKQVPVIFLTARGSLTDKVRGLKLGAEDYIVKPFEAPELLARVEVVLRRSGRKSPDFELAGTRVNLDSHQVVRGGVPVELTAQEFSLLEALIINCGMALSREKLLEIAWGYDYMGESRTVDMHIQRLRRKLGWENAIKTVYKYGYRLEREEP